MKIKMSTQNFNETLKNLQKEYKVYAPVSIPFKGTYSDTDLVRYNQIKSIEEVEFNKKSNFSPKEIVLPITQTLFYFTEDAYIEPSIDDKKILIFLRSCDIHGLKRVDEIYLNNGQDPDYYYKRLRDKVKYVLIGCQESFRNCFCVSMGSNKTDEYSMGLKVENNEVYLDIKDEDLANYFSGETTEFEVDYVKENNVTVNIPENLDPLVVSQATELWEEYNSRCIACGRCNFSCPTCTCFTMQDIFYKDNEKNGERRRVWASCQVDGYTDMAGGHSFRKNKGDRMRFKTLHKVYDFNKKFGYHMCVGCGRCDDACPQYISFSTCINKVYDFVNSKEDEINEECVPST